MKTKMKCSQCPLEKETAVSSVGNARIPQGWHRTAIGCFCGGCWKAKYILRAITFPVVGPVDAEWKDLRKALGSVWQESTALANWAMTQLRLNDVVRTPKAQKCPPMPAVYLYGLASKSYAGWGHWQGSRNSAQSLFRTVEKKYRSERFKVIWTCQQSLANYRYPVPYPIHNRNWTPSFSEGNCPIISVPIGAQRWTLRLKGGAQMGRQLKDFRKIVSGEAVQCEMAIYQRSDTVLAKLVAWLPKPPPSEHLHTMLLRTDPNAFMVAEVEGRSPFILNRDDIKRTIEVHRVYRQRMSEDLKHEKRWAKDKRQQMLDALNRRCTKQNNRLDSFCHETSACLANYAHRNRVGEVIYDPQCTTYLPSFPWHQFKERLAYKLDALGIQFTSVSQEPVSHEGV